MHYAVACITMGLGRIRIEGLGSVPGTTPLVAKDKIEVTFDENGSDVYTFAVTGRNCVTVTRFLMIKWDFNCFVQELM